MSRRRTGWDVPSRGEQTRDAMLRAGVDQLLELGWTSLTVRSVSARAGVSASLLTYHFDGVGRFRRAVLAEALTYMLQPLLHVMTTGRSVTGGVAAALTLLADEAAAARDRPTERYEDLLGYGPPGPEHRRVLADVVVASLQDAVAREVVKESLVLARLQLLGWLEGVGVPPEHLDGAAALLVALLDGVLLHQQVDPTLPVEQVAELVEQVAELLRAADRAGQGGFAAPAQSRAGPGGTAAPAQSARSAGTTSFSNSSMPLVS